MNAMDSGATASDRQPSPPPGPSRHRPSPRSLLFAAILVLLVAISAGVIAKTRFPPHHPLRRLSSWLSSHRLLRPLPRLLSPAARRGAGPADGAGKSPPARPPCVLWMAPFVSGGGYSSEAWSYVAALDRRMREGVEGPPLLRLAIEQHGDSENLEFWSGLPEEDRALALRLHGTECRLSEAVVVCHSEPGAWHPPLFQTPPCPPAGYAGPLAVVGRTMFETDRLDPEHARRCNRMDAVWVPTDFHRSIFVAGGVEASKVAKVVQAVDAGLFDPAKHEPLALPTVGPALGSAPGGSSARPRGKNFAFLSVFKWEHRKGWDVLLASYLREFAASDGVSLHLLTNPYHSDADFGNRVAGFAEDAGLEEPAEGWAPVYVMDRHVPQADLPKLYRAADAFVLPSRGEGWGRPVVEAMAMGLPVIVTNWSGPTEYLTEENGYPLAVEGMSEVSQGPFRGHLRAEPSVEHLRALMRRVVSRPEEARRRGRRAREDMIRRFSPDVVARVVVDRILEVLEHDDD